MQSLFSRTLLSLLFVSLLLNCTGLPEPSAGVDQPTAEITIVNEPVQEEILPHLELAASYVGTTELTGQNDGPEVERFLASVGLQAGNPYCAAFVSYILDETPGIHKPTVRSGLASHFITNASIDARVVLRGSQDIEPGSILIWQKGNTIYGHTGYVEEQEDISRFLTIEANTSSGVYGSQADGDGVFRRERTIQPANYFRITSFTPVVYHS